MQNKFKVKFIIKILCLIMSLVIVLALSCFGVFYIATDGNIKISTIRSEYNVQPKSTKVVTFNKKANISKDFSIKADNAYYKDSKLYIEAAITDKKKIASDISNDNFLLMGSNTLNENEMSIWKCEQLNNKVKTDDTTKYMLEFDIGKFQENNMYTLYFYDNNKIKQVQITIKNSNIAQ